MKTTVNQMSETTIPWDRAAEIFQMGMENHAYLDGITKGHRPLALYFLACLFVCPRSDHHQPKLAFLNGSLQNKLFHKYIGANEDYLQVCHGRFFSTVGRLRHAFTIYSIASRVERIKLCYSACQQHHALHLKESGSIWLWIEFCFIKRLLETSHASTISVFGLADRYTTWLSYLSQALGQTFEIYLHGIVGENYDLPYKAHCDHLYCYDKKTKEILERRFIQNDDCACTLTGFVSAIEFESFPNKNRPLVVVIGEHNTQQCAAMAKSIAALLPDVQVIIMPHPGESASTYKSLLAGIPSTSVLLEFKKRFSNVDVLVAISSTLVYDYLSSGYHGVIVAVKNEYFSYDMESGRYLLAESEEDVPRKVQEALSLK